MGGKQSFLSSRCCLAHLSSPDSQGMVQTQTCPSEELFVLSCQSSQAVCILWAMIPPPPPSSGKKEGKGMLLSNEHRPGQMHPAAVGLFSLPWQTHCLYLVPLLDLALISVPNPLLWWNVNSRCVNNCGTGQPGKGMKLQGEGICRESGYLVTQSRESKNEKSSISGCFSVLLLLLCLSSEREILRCSRIGIGKPSFLFPSFKKIPCEKRELPIIPAGKGRTASQGTAPASALHVAAEVLCITFK